MEDFAMHLDFDTMKSTLESVIMEGDAVIQSGDMGQSRIGRVMHILGSAVLGVLEGIGPDNWNELQAARQSGDLQAFRARPGDGMNAADMPTQQALDAGDATGATGTDGADKHPATLGDGQQPVPAASIAPGQPGMTPAATPAGDAGADVRGTNATS